MKLIVQADGKMGVNGEVREIDVSDLPQGVQSMYFDTVRGQGQMEFDQEALVQIQERDLAAEAEIEAQTNKELLHELRPIYRDVMVQRTPEPITDPAIFQPFYMRWQAAVPPPPPEPTAEELAERAQTEAGNTAIAAFTLGAVSAKNRVQLRAMSFAEFSTWFDLNFDTVPRLIQLLKRLTFIIIRRVL